MGDQNQEKSRGTGSAGAQPGNDEGERGRDGKNVQPHPDTGKKGADQSGQGEQQRRDETHERPGQTGGRR